MFISRRPILPPWLLAIGVQASGRIPLSKAVDMPYFISSISGKQFPLAERLAARGLSNGVMAEIQKNYPEFTLQSCLAKQELEPFRKAYLQNLLAQEIGTITDLERKVLDTINQNELLADEASEIKQSLTAGQRMADIIAHFGGSWRFIIIFFIFLATWMLVNTELLYHHSFDPYPFILLNLILSCIAAIQAPVIMMSQNRQEEKDRQRARNDYMINLKGELEIRLLHEKVDHLLLAQEQVLQDQTRLQTDMLIEVAAQLRTATASSH